MYKRILDLIIVFISLPFFLPVVITISILIYAINGKPIIFSQSRGGYKGSIFNIYKFRTMKTVQSKNESEASRITKLGKFLRKTSLDEIPSIYNVIKGDMSIVGPRPLLSEYLTLYNDSQKKRHNIKPGITGWAQINGRNAITWDKKFKLDIWYIENQSIFLDFKIIIKTIIKVLSQESISQSEIITMKKFTGDKK